MPIKVIRCIQLLIIILFHFNNYSQIKITFGKLFRTNQKKPLKALNECSLHLIYSGTSLLRTLWDLNFSP